VAKREENKVKINVEVNIVSAAEIAYSFTKQLKMFLESEARDYSDIDELVDSLENLLYKCQPEMSSWVVLEYLKENNEI
jgi:hypothetical protein